MEKRRPTYDLQAFKKASAENKIEVTGAALRGAASLGLTVASMKTVIERMQRGHFFKSMTSYGDHRSWQDVYHVPFGEVIIYVKFTADLVAEFRLLSFKEK